MTLSQILDWLSSHWTAAWPVVSAVLILVLRSRTPAEWVALGERSPRWQGVVRLLRAVGLDPAKAVSAFVQIVTARAPAAVPPSPSKVVPVDHRGERGSVRVGALLVIAGATLVATLAGAVLTGCPPAPPVDGGPAVTPSGWTSTARVVLDTLRWAVPAARAITDNVVPEPARTQVGRALDATGDAARELSAAVDAYEQRGGDRCAAHAAVGGLHRALVGLARVLADSGIALGTTLERVVDGVASVADALVPACDRDAGWSSSGDRANAELRAISTGRVLSRVLDGLRPALDGGL